MRTALIDQNFTTTIFVPDDTGAGATGLTTSNTDFQRVDPGSNSTSFTSSSLTEVDATTMPGVYRLEVSAITMDELGEYRFALIPDASDVPTKYIKVNVVEHTSTTAHNNLQETLDDPVTTKLSHLENLAGNIRSRLEPNTNFDRPNFFFVNNNGILAKIDPDTNIVWKNDDVIPDDSSRSMAFQPRLDALLVASQISLNNTRIYRIDAETGEQVWRTEESIDTNTTEISVDDNYVYAADSSNLWRYNLEDGSLDLSIEEAWDADAVDTDSDGTWWVGSNDTSGDRLFKYDEQGNQLLAVSVRVESLAVGPDQVLAYGNDGLYGIDKETGDILWTFDDFIDTSTRTVVVDDKGMAYLASGREWVYAVRTAPDTAAQERVAWEYEFAQDFNAVPGVSVDPNGVVYAVNRSQGEITRFDSKGNLLDRTFIDDEGWSYAVVNEPGFVGAFADEWKEWQSDIPDSLSLLESLVGDSGGGETYFEPILEQLDVLSGLDADILKRLNGLDDKTTTSLRLDSTNVMPVRIFAGSEHPNREIIPPMVDASIIKAEDGEIIPIDVTDDNWELLDLDKGIYLITLDEDVLDQEGELVVLIDDQPAWIEKNTGAGDGDDDDIVGVYSESVDTTGIIYAITRDGRILESDDMGDTWTTEENTGTPLLSIDGIDNGQVAAVGEDFRVWAKGLVGPDWAQVNPNSPDSGLVEIFYDVHAYSEDSVWAVGGFYPESDDPVEVENPSSLVGWYDGSLFNLLDVSDAIEFENNTEDARILSVHQSDDNTVWLGLYGEGTGTVEQTYTVILKGIYDEGVQEWSFQKLDNSKFPENPNVGGNPRYFVNDIEFIDENRGVYVAGTFSGFNTVVGRTNDGGETWEHLTDSPVGSWSTLSAVNERLGVEWWTDGEIWAWNGFNYYTSNDGGETWSDSINVATPVYDLQVFEDENPQALLGSREGEVYLLDHVPFDEKEIQTQVTPTNSEDVLDAIRKTEAVLDDLTTSHVVQGTSYTFPVRFSEESVLEGEFILSALKPGQEQPEPVLLTPDNWTDVGNVGSPFRNWGLLELPAEVTDTLGELLLLMEPVYGFDMIESNRESLQDAYIASSGQGWVVSGNNGGSLRTEDYGETWEPDEGLPDSYPAIDGFDENNVWVGGFSNQEILYWDGTEWELVFDNDTDGNAIESIYADQDHGVFVAAAVQGGDSRILGWDGTTFEQIHEETDYLITDVVSVADDTIWAVAVDTTLSFREDNDILVLEGTFDGSEWTFDDRSSEFANARGRSSEKPHIDAVNTLFTSYDIVMVSGNGRIYRSPNSGTDWIELDSPIADDTVPRNLIMQSDEVIWVATTNSMLVSFNEGETFARVQGPTTGTNVIGLALVDEKDAILWVAGSLIAYLGEGRADFLPKNIQIQVVEPPEAILDDVSKDLDSLLRSNIANASSIPQETTYRAPIRIRQEGQAVMSVSEGSVTVTAIKADDTVNSFGLNGSWVEVDNENLPGLYLFDIPDTATDVRGDLLIDVTAEMGESPWQPQETPEIGTNLNDIVVKEAQENFIALAASDDDRIYNYDPQNEVWVVDTDITGADVDLIAVDFDPDTFTFAFVSTADPSDGEPRVLLAQGQDQFVGGGGGYFDSEVGDLLGVTVVQQAVMAMGDDVLLRLWIDNGDVVIEEDYTDDLETPENIVWRDGSDINGPVDLVVGSDATILGVDSAGAVGPGNQGVFGASTIPGTDADLYAIAYDQDNDDVWVVGEGGAVYKSENSFFGELDWQEIDLDTSSTLTSVDVFSGRVAIVGEGGAAFVSEDGGNTWNDLRSPGQNFKGVALLEQFTLDGGFVVLSPFTWAVAGDPNVYEIEGSTDDIALDFTVFNQMLRYQVVGDDVEVSLEPVLEGLADMKGAGFDTREHSLVELAAAINAGDVDLQPVLDELDNIQGVNFDSSADSLKQLSDALATLDFDSDFSNIVSHLETLSSDVEDVQQGLLTLREQVKRILGLTQENFEITDYTRTSENKLSSASINLYESSDMDNVLATYTIDASYDSSGLMANYQVVKDED